MKVIVNVDENCIEDEVVITCREWNENIMNLQKSIASSMNQNLRLELMKEGKECFVDVSEILFFETEEGQVMVHTVGDIFTTEYRLYTLEKMLPWYFMRVSKSTILNTKEIYAITKNLTASSLVEFRGTPKQVYVSRSYYKPLRSKLEEMRNV